MAPIAAVVLGVIDLLTKLIPIITQAKLFGTVSPEEQQKVLDAYNALRAQGDAAFAAEHWQIKPPAI